MRFESNHRLQCWDFNIVSCGVKKKQKPQNNKEAVARPPTENAANAAKTAAHLVAFRCGRVKAVVSSMTDFDKKTKFFYQRGQFARWMGWRNDEFTWRRLGATSSHPFSKVTVLINAKNYTFIFDVLRASLAVTFRSWNVSFSATVTYQTPLFTLEIA